VNDSVDFLRELHKADKNLVSLDHVKIAYFSKRLNRTKGVVQPGRLGFYQFASFGYSTHYTAGRDGIKKVGYAQIRCISQAVADDKSKILCFLVRCVCVLT
jgi:hypothetical protein